MNVGFMDFPNVPARKPSGGSSPAIDVASHPNGTPIVASANQVRGRRFTLYGRKPNGDDNAAEVRIGKSGFMPQIVAPGQEVPLECADDSLIDLADYTISGTDGDGVQYFLVP